MTRSRPAKRAQNGNAGERQHKFCLANRPAPLWAECHTKKGSYIVESVIVVPIFIMAVVMLMSIVPIIAACENVNFATADEMRLECIKTAFRKNPAALPVTVKHRVYSENKNVNSYQTVFYRYLYTAKGIDDLVSLDFHVNFKEKNPLGLFSSVNYKGKITARAFTGTLQKQAPAERQEFEEEKESHIVYIFPEWGKRYHNQSCTYVRSNCQMVYLSQDTKKKYSACKLCQAKTAQAGSPVFCFRASGEVYHLAGCRMIDKYYIEIEREEAESKWYTPCSKCVGG